MSRMTQRRLWLLSLMLLWILVGCSAAAPTDGEEKATRMADSAAAPVGDMPHSANGETLQPDHTVIDRGELWSSPGEGDIVGHVCPGDQVVQRGEEGEWLQVRTLILAGNCIPERAMVGTEGWVQRSAVVHQGPIVATQPRMPANLELATLVRVVDGDTLVVLMGGEEERVRMLGIDAPESVHPTQPVECYGREASIHTSALVEGSPILLLEADPSQANQDRFGRFLRYVWLADGQMVNYRLVNDGFAFEYTFQVPYAYQGHFTAAQERARTEQVGLWAPDACDGRRTVIEDAPTQPTATPRTLAPRTTSPPPPPPPSRPSGCDPAYPDVCIPSPPPDLDCEDIPHCRFRVLRPDPHNFDGDGDGIGCERCPSP